MLFVDIISVFICYIYFFIGKEDIDKEIEWQWSHDFNCWRCYANLSFIPRDEKGKIIELEGTIAVNAYMDFIMDKPWNTFGSNIATLKILKRQLKLGIYINKEFLFMCILLLFIFVVFF